MRRFGTVGVIKLTYPLDEAATGSNHRGRDKQEKRNFSVRLYANEFYFIFGILIFWYIWHETARQLHITRTL